MPKFKDQCERVERQTGVSLSMFTGEFSRFGSTTVVEDDGALIIQKAGQRAVFNIDQDQPLRAQNRRIESVLRCLGLDRFIPATVHGIELVEEEESCPHCGQRMP